MFAKSKQSLLSLHTPYSHHDEMLPSLGYCRLNHRSHSSLRAGFPLVAPLQKNLERWDLRTLKKTECSGGEPFSPLGYVFLFVSKGTIVNVLLTTPYDITSCIQLGVVIAQFLKWSEPIISKKTARRLCWVAANRPEELKYAYRTIRFRPLVGCLKQLDMVGQLLRLRSEWHSWTN